MGDDIYEFVIAIGIIVVLLFGLQAVVRLKSVSPLMRALIIIIPLGLLAILIAAAHVTECQQRARIQALTDDIERRGEEYVEVMADLGISVGEDKEEEEVANPQNTKRLYSPHFTELPVARELKYLEQMLAAAEVDDFSTMIELKNKGNIIGLPTGLFVKVISSSGDFREIKALMGEHKGATFWVQNDLLKDL